MKKQGNYSKRTNKEMAEINQMYIFSENLCFFLFFAAHFFLQKKMSSEKKKKTGIFET
jgi:heme/copper-type cytochrome/quinol oxidase subunit 3